MGEGGPGCPRCEQLMLVFAVDGNDVTWLCPHCDEVLRTKEYPAPPAPAEGTRT